MQISSTASSFKGMQKLFLTLFWMLLLLPHAFAQNTDNATTALSSVTQKAELISGKAAVWYVFDATVRADRYEWLKRKVQQEWFAEGVIPRECYICSNVYRHSVDNGSLIARGVANQQNRNKLAEMMGVHSFLMVLVTQSAEDLRVEATHYVLSEEKPVFAEVRQWGIPRFPIMGLSFGASSSNKQHQSFLMGLHIPVRLMGSWYFLGSSAILLGTKNDAGSDLTGFNVDGSLERKWGWSPSFYASNSIGFGQMMTSAVNAAYLKVGMRFTMGAFSLDLNYKSLLGSNNSEPSSISSLLLGWEFE